ncbi:MAG: PAS domain S-box protein [Nitriliruptoraceae bacterium]|nr:PAS domain S-box protein [Nitriliruptoraceae bacterium]
MTEGVFAAALGAIPDAVMVTDPDEVILWVNAAFTAMSGFPADEAIGATPQLLHAGVQDRATYEGMWPTIVAGGAWRGEFVNRHRSGQLYTVIQTITPVLDEDGTVTHYVAIHTDVTLQHRTAAERDFHAQLVAVAGNAIIATDLTGRVTFWNRAAEHLYGWSSDEACGRNILELNVNPDATEHAERVLTQLREGVSWSGEFEVRHRDGTRFPALVTNAPYLDAAGELAGIIGVSVDITDLRDAQARAQQRASQQTAVAELGRRALTDLDLEQTCKDVIDVVASELDVPLVKILELTPDRDELLLKAGVGWQDGLVGRVTVANDRRSQAGFTLLQDRAVIVEDLTTETRFRGPQLLDDHGVVAGMSTPIRGRDGDYGILAVHTTRPRPFTDDEAVFLDTVAGVIGAAVARDRTEQQLRVALDELVRSDEIRVAFLRATSHELRTPLTSIVGFAELLHERGDRLDTDGRRVLLERLTANTSRLARLIHDLLDVDRLTAGLMIANLETHDLARLVHRVIADQQLTDRRLELDLEPVTARVDPPKFERVVANLVANAARHTPPTGTIKVSLERQPTATLLVVEDDGPGIDPAYLAAIFEPFVQGPDQQRSPQPGTGLGLTLARELVELHHGTLTAANRPSGGARFEVRLVDTGSADDELSTA